MYSFHLIPATSIAAASSGSASSTGSCLQICGAPCVPVGVTSYLLNRGLPFICSHNVFSSSRGFFSLSAPCVIWRNCLASSSFACFARSLPITVAGPAPSSEPAAPPCTFHSSCDSPFSAYDFDPACSAHDIGLSCLSWLSTTKVTCLSGF